MHNYEHKKLIESISRLDIIPDDPSLMPMWLKAEAHLDFLLRNGQANDFVIYASGEFSFIHSVAVPIDSLEPLDTDDLMSWCSNPYRSVASYVTGGGREGVWIERGLHDTGTKSLSGGIQLIYGRTFEGWTGSGANYFELNQEYAHLAGIHWRPELHAYCRFDEHGDLYPVVSITNRNEKKDNVTLVTFKWEPLEEYLAANNCILLRMFDFTLLDRSKFSGWSYEPAQKFQIGDDIFFRQRIMPETAAFTRGVQIIRTRRPRSCIFSGITDGWFGDRTKEFVEFIAQDWRNDRITKISTDPDATVNYFNAKGTELPFELSPAYFRPEVLLKYKADRDKYTVGEREISCRASWHLKAIDVNEAGQVHAYICYLRDLPYSEQLHWLSFNEPPKSGISKRAITTDFEGKFVTDIDSLTKTLMVVKRWHDDSVVEWWTLREKTLVERVTVPHSSSRDEWAESFMDLAKLVVEGFETKYLRLKLEEASIPYSKDDRSLSLLEKLLNLDSDLGGDCRLSGLRTLQNLRSKVKGHVGGSDAEELARKALMDHGTFSNHFMYVCEMVSNDLNIIEKYFYET